MECWGGKKYPLSNINCEIYFLCIYDILYFTKKKIAGEKISSG